MLLYFVSSARSGLGLYRETERAGFRRDLPRVIWVSPTLIRQASESTRLIEFH